MALSVLKILDLQSKTNNTEHRTSEISVDELIVRRGQPFTVTLHLTEAFKPDLHHLKITVETGEFPSEERGTKSCFGIPDNVRRSPLAKAVWKAELQRNQQRAMILIITPPADTPIGEYKLSLKHKQEELLVKIAVLFNPWCPDDWVFLPDERERAEYFEPDMVKICLKLLDVNRKHLLDPADDVSARCNPIYVGRVVSTMINSADDSGVLQGNWGNSFAVMRLLGIPCRVISNFQSAHDNNENLIIDVYHADYGVREKESRDSIWNYHVWVEGWMRRPDLSADGKYDGWQVLDPTPQERSDGVYCCGPAPLAAILEGETNLKYDVPFVFAEVNADCVDWWSLKADGSKVKIFSDTRRVGQNISTKALNSNKRQDITHTYKHTEGTEKERITFGNAVARLTNGGNHGENGNEGGPDETLSVPPVTMRFEEVSKPVNGKDVSLKLVLTSKSREARPLLISISVQAMKYNGRPAFNIQKELKEETLLPGKELVIPVLIPFSVYHRHMVLHDSMKISALVMDKNNLANTYLAEDDIVLQYPPISLTMASQIRVGREARAEVVFRNPIDETLTGCTANLTGSGLISREPQFRLPDLRKNQQLRIQFSFFPYKTGVKTMVVNFDCSAFKNIKASSTVTVMP
ncbi:hypothetical protein INR49_031974 [Caranx melampygus]|nr:hypothetical protein INR49_031974 [Caranx melampygus]